MKSKTVPSLFTIIFENGSSYRGGNYRNTKWNSMPDKKIKYIFYSLPYGDALFLSNYDKYYHMIEVTKDINGIDRGKVKLEYAYIMGIKKDKVAVYKISLKSTKNYIDRTVLDINDEYIKKLNPIGWK